MFLAYMDKDSEVHVEVDKFFEPLELACESRHPKIMEIALDALHFLIGEIKTTAISCFSYLLFQI